MFSLSHQSFRWAELKDIFRKFGEVTYTDAHYRSGDGRGEVCFATREDQDRCLDEAEGMDINGRSNLSILSEFHICFQASEFQLVKELIRVEEEETREADLEVDQEVVVEAAEDEIEATDRVLTEPNSLSEWTIYRPVASKLFSFNLFRKLRKIKLGGVERSHAKSRRSNLRRCSHAFRTR